MANPRLDDYEILRLDLKDPNITGWKCPQCAHDHYKVFGMECEECGFDATPYAPSGSEVKK